MCIIHSHFAVSLVIWGYLLFFVWPCSFFFCSWKKSEKSSSSIRLPFLLASAVRNSISSHAKKNPMRAMKKSKIDAKNNNWCFIGKLICSHAITNAMCIIIWMLDFFFEGLFFFDIYCLTVHFIFHCMIPLNALNLWKIKMFMC